MERPWCWEKLKVGEGDGRRWDGWMVSPMQWTWVWVVSGSWWWTGRPGMLQSMGLKRVGTQLSDWTELITLIMRSLRLRGWCYLLKIACLENKDPEFEPGPSDPISEVIPTQLVVDLVIKWCSWVNCSLFLLHNCPKVLGWWFYSLMASTVIKPVCEMWMGIRKAIVTESKRLLYI